jgi:cytochrome P450
LIHTNKQFWGEDAAMFKPERFREENTKNRHPYSYVPFSGGSRMCPGVKYSDLTLKIFLCKFIKKYRVTTKLKMEDLDFELAVSAILKQGVMVKVEKR